MLMEEGGIVIGKLHKYSHTWFLMKGEIMVATDLGTETYTAPCYVNAPAGAKRVIYAIEDSVFINVHPNPKNITNIEELENMLTCKSYEAFDKYKQLKQ
jgi:quercetin dioxygenase-like cupin family protein